MSQYFLKLPGASKPAAYSEFEVREFLGQGIITPQTLTWKQGMDDWRPVCEVLPQEAPIPAPAPDEEIKETPAHDAPAPPLPYPPKKGFMKLVIASTLIMLGSTLWSLWIKFTYIKGANITMQDIQNAIEQHLMNLPPAIMALSLLIIPAIIVLLVWTYRSAANLKARQIPGLRFTPFISVIFTCMPIFGLMMNALIMQEFYKASATPKSNWMMTTPPKALRMYLFCAAVLTCMQFFPLAADYAQVDFYLNAGLMSACAIFWLISAIKISQKQLNNK